MPVTFSSSERDSITMRVDIQNKPGMEGMRTRTIGETGGDIGALDMSGLEGLS